MSILQEIGFESWIPKGFSFHGAIAAAPLFYALHYPDW